MFNKFKKQQPVLVEHRFKNLLIFLPSHWQYELEEGDLEACFDPKSQSTLRLHIVKLIAPADIAAEDDIKIMTANQQYIVTANNFLFTSAAYSNAVDSGNQITLITWKLIAHSGDEKVMAVATYTVLSTEKDSKEEKAIFNLIENSLKNAKLV